MFGTNNAGENPRFKFLGRFEHQLVNDCLRLVPGAVTSRDLEAATRMAAHKDLFRKLEDRVIDDHLNQDAATKRVSLRASALFVDLVRDLHRINAPCRGRWLSSDPGGGATETSRA